jgi:hypothetical protein
VSRLEPKFCAGLLFPPGIQVADDAVNDPAHAGSILESPHRPSALAVPLDGAGHVIRRSTSLGPCRRHRRYALSHPEPEQGEPEYDAEDRAPEPGGREEIRRH